MCRTGTNIRYRKDGRWEARFIKSRNENGKADYSSFYGHTYKEALKMSLITIYLPPVIRDVYHLSSPDGYQATSGDVTKKV